MILTKHQYYFATYFDINYLGRGLTLLKSLDNHCSQEFRLFILALDKTVADYFNNNVRSNITIIQLDELENYFPQLHQIRLQRSEIEYYFTLSPFLPLYILEKYNIAGITTLDADLYFFDDPVKIFNAYPSASVLITPHDFSTSLSHLEKYGRYNVSFQYFKNDEIGKSCLNRWKNDCADWCFDYFDENNNRFADQKYLDSWIAQHHLVQSIDLKHTGRAPWNIGDTPLTFTNKHFEVNGQRLIYYHFHHLRVLNSFFAYTGLKEYGVTHISPALKKLYHRYLRSLRKNSRYQAAGDEAIKRLHLSKGLKDRINDPGGVLVTTSLFTCQINPYLMKQRSKKIIKKVLWLR